MIEGLFDIAIDTPKRHKRGTLELKSEGERIDARLVVKDVLDMEFTGTCADKEFDFSGNAEFPDLGQVDYEAHGSVWGNSVTVKCMTDAGKVDLFGTRLSSSTGSAKSSHEYMMAAARGDISDKENTMYSGLYADGG